MAAEICAVDFNRAGQNRAVRFRCHALAQFVLQNESRAILYVEIAAELQSSVSLRTVRKNRDGGQNILERQFAAREDRAGRCAKLRRAFRAFEDAAALVAVDRNAAT